MAGKIEQFLASAGRTLDFAPDAPRALHDRLRFVAALFEEAGGEVAGPRLVYRDAAHAVRSVPIAGELVVGRGAPAGFIVDSPKLSRRHFRVLLDPSGPAVEDLGSRNGTWVNGLRVRRRRLVEGDVIEAGGIAFVYVAA